MRDDDLTFAIYNTKSEGLSWVAGSPDEAWYIALGLGGEAGEVLELVKKAARPGGTLDVVATSLELGDLLWYVARMARKLGITVEDVAQLNLLKIGRRKLHGKDVAAERAQAEEYLRGRTAQHERAGMQACWLLARDALAKGGR